MGFLKLLGFGILALLVGMVAFGLLDSGQPSAPKPAHTPEQKAERAERDSLELAAYTCKEAVRQSLHDPGSVQWDESPGWYRERKPEGHIVVQARARAKNAFGAYRHGVWECSVLPVGDNVRVTGLEQIRR